MKKKTFTSLISNTILILQLLSLFSFTFSVKPEKKENTEAQLNPKKIKNLNKYDKVCKITDKCRECTFEELKNIPECQVNGHKEIKHCIYSDGKIDVDEEYVTNSCDENIRTNPVYWCLVIFVFIGAVSFYVRKTQKNFMIKSMLEKLSIIKEK